MPTGSIKGPSRNPRSSLHVNDIMALRTFHAEDIVGALFDRDFGLRDSESSSEDEDDERIHGYRGSSFFAPAGAHQVEGWEEDFPLGSENGTPVHEGMSSTLHTISEDVDDEVHQSPERGISPSRGGEVSSQHEPLNNGVPIDVTVSIDV